MDLNQELCDGHVLSLARKMLNYTLHALEFVTLNVHFQDIDVVVSIHLYEILDRVEGRTCLGVSLSCDADLGEVCAALGLETFESRTEFVDTKIVTPDLAVWCPSNELFLVCGLELDAE